MDNLTLHIRKFNDKVRMLNSAGSKNLVLTAQEARSLHADIQDILSHCVLLSKKLEAMSQADSKEVISITVDGGKF